MSYTNGNSSKASKKEVRTEEKNNEIKMGFKVSGGFFSEDKDKIVIKETQTINKAIPMFEIVEKSFGEYKKGTNSKGETVIVTRNAKYVKAEDGKYKATSRTRRVEER